MSTVKGTFYVQMKADRLGGRVTGVKAIRLTQSKPGLTDPDSIAVKVNLSIPVEAFALVPEVNVEVPIAHVGVPTAESTEYPVAVGVEDES